MVDFNALRKILNGAGMNVKKYANGARVCDSGAFKGARLSALEEAQSLVIDAVKQDTYNFASRACVQLDSVRTVTERARRSWGQVVDCLLTQPKSPAERLVKSFSSPSQIRDSIVNSRWNNGTPLDPSVASVAFPNVYISPYEAASLYSQKGLFETVINKKSKSILLNGIRIENPKLSTGQLDEVNARLEVQNIKSHIANSVRDSLVYGGSILFPMFKRDNPVTTGLPLSSLLKLGVIGKDCLDYFVSLDRWNVFIIPPTNPTQKDFYRPEVYTIPFLGSDVHYTRCARVVTAEQAGYWGVIMNQGWGISDFCGYLQSGMNYKVVVQSLPLMIQQMSILARVVNVDGTLATEGSNALDALVEENTIRTREASPDNPVTMDVLGELKSIDRNFGQVPELIRLLRQDFSSDCTIPEPMLFSSEKGNFASGDDIEGNQSKQWEAVKMIHKDTERQFKQIAKILVVDALGADSEILKALPDTRIRFDEPVIANALERSEIGKHYSENVFNLVSAQIPIDIAVEMASKNVSQDMAVSNDVLERLKSIQRKVDKQDEERFQVEMALQRAQVERAESGEGDVGGGAGGAGSPKKKEEGKWKKHKDLERDKEGYGRLEQRRHETTRVGSTKRSEGIAKAQNKNNNLCKTTT